MVDQYKNNKYEKIFYDLDKKISLADYQTVYYLPRMKSMLDYIFTNKNSANAQVQEIVESNLITLRNELKLQTEQFGEENYPYLHVLSIANLDSSLYESTRDFLNTITKVHAKRNKEALFEKQDMIREMTSSPKKVAAYNKLKRNHTNDEVTNLVFDNKEKTRILEYEGRLIQQIYPIFSEPDPVHYFDFRTLFYVPVKYFAGRHYETLLFNVAIMWIMTCILIITLYHDVLRKLVMLGDRVKSKNS
jgi:hypothetical protein